MGFRVKPASPRLQAVAHLEGSQINLFKSRKITKKLVGLQMLLLLSTRSVHSPSTTAVDEHSCASLADHLF